MWILWLKLLSSVKGQNLLDINGKDSNTIQQSLYGRFLGGKGREEVQRLASGEGGVCALPF